MLNNADSFCERCGTRYPFHANASKTLSLKGARVLAKGLKNFVLTDGQSLNDSMTLAREADEHEITTRMTEAFHRTFNFCMTCRQYACDKCWNPQQGACLTCAPEAGLGPVEPEDHLIVRTPVARGDNDWALFPDILGSAGQPAAEAPPRPAWPVQDLHVSAREPDSDSAGGHERLVRQSEDREAWSVWPIADEIAPEMTLTPAEMVIIEAQLAQEAVEGPSAGPCDRGRARVCGDGSATEALPTVFRGRALSSTGVRPRPKSRSSSPCLRRWLRRRVRPRPKSRSSSPCLRRWLRRRARPRPRNEYRQSPASWAASRCAATLRSAVPHPHPHPHPARANSAASPGPTRPSGRVVPSRPTIGSRTRAQRWPSRRSPRSTRRTLPPRWRRSRPSRRSPRSTRRTLPPRWRRSRSSRRLCSRPQRPNRATKSRARASPLPARSEASTSWSRSEWPPFQPVPPLPLYEPIPVASGQQTLFDAAPAGDFTSERGLESAAQPDAHPEVAEVTPAPAPHATPEPAPQVATPSPRRSHHARARAAVATPSPRRHSPRPARPCPEAPPLYRTPQAPAAWPTNRSQLARKRNPRRTVAGSGSSVCAGRSGGQGGFAAGPRRDVGPVGAGSPQPRVRSGLPSLRPAGLDPGAVLSPLRYQASLTRGRS